MTRTKIILRSQPQTILGTPNDAVVLIQPGGQQRRAGTLPLAVDDLNAWAERLAPATK